MKKVRRGHRLHIFIYMLIFVGLILVEQRALVSLFSKYPHVEEVHYEKIPKIIETNEITVEQAVFPRTHEVQMNAVEITYEEAQLLLKVAQAEAGNQGSDGMWLVMSVVMNRTTEDSWPSTIKEVIYENHKTKEGKVVYQFSTAGNGSIDKVEISPECHEALARIERGDVAPEIIAFETTKSKTLDKYFSCAFTYRDHQFYTMKGE